VAGWCLAGELAMSTRITRIKLKGDHARVLTEDGRDLVFHPKYPLAHGRDPSALYTTIFRCARQKRVVEFNVIDNRIISMEELW